MQVWDLQQGKCIRTLVGHSRAVQKLCAERQRLFSVGGRALRVWDLDTYLCIHVIHLPHDSGTLTALAVDPGRMLYIAGQVRLLCSLTTPAPLYVSREHLLDISLGC